MQLTDDEYFDIVNKYRNEMFNLIDKTRKTSKEHAFKLCYDEKTKKITKGNEAIGEKGKVTIQSCGKNKKNLFSYHTHNYKLFPLSREDILASISHSDLFFCVGSQGHGEKNDEIHCYSIDYKPRMIKEFNNSERFDTWSFKKVTTPLFTIKRTGEIIKKEAPYF